MREQLIVLGTRIKKIRKERKMTLQALADRTGLTAGLLSKIEKKNRNGCWSGRPTAARLNGRKGGTSPTR